MANWTSKYHFKRLLILVWPVGPDSLDIEPILGIVHDILNHGQLISAD
jgi:hypothetical protein